jgi:hypothetical protein
MTEKQYEKLLTLVEWILALVIARWIWYYLILFFGALP